MTTLLQSLFYFVLAGLMEIGGGYLVWLWLREGKPLWFGILGISALALYTMVHTLQPPANFGRVYAAYGGVFIILSLLWGWLWDGIAPDRWERIGAFIILMGVWIIMYAPRN